jgi:vancomycin resistance protein YoaR
MGQSSLNWRAITSMAKPGHGEPAIPAIRSWPLLAWSRIRNAVLPDPDAPLPVRAPARRAASSSRSPWGRLVSLLPRVALGSFLLLLLAAIGIFAFRQMYSDRIYPSVVVAGVDVGGLTAAEAETRLAERAAEIEQGTIVFTHDGQTWTPTLQDLGATVDLSGSAAEAFAQGREGDAGARLAFTGAILDAHQQAPLQMQVDTGALNAWFDKVDRDIGKLAVDARIVIKGDSISIADSHMGSAVDRDAVTPQILAALSTLQPAVIDLAMRPDHPTMTRETLKPVQGTVEGMLQTTIRATYGSETWQIDGADLVPHLLVDVAMENGSPVPRFSMDIEGLASTLRGKFAGEVNRDPVNAILGWDGGVLLREESTDGAVLKATPFAEAIAASFLGDNDPVEVPVLVLKPEIDNDNYDDLGIDELLGQGDSNFSYGVPGRDENVRLATEYMNGTLVAPGEEFSFNDAVGEVTAERGFQEALVVQGEGIGRDVGGGVCQVSTTVFRAALMAGMPITEWYQHTYRLPNYEYDGWSPGFDASILQYGSDPATWPDFQFENYTGRWLLVQSYVDYPRVYVNIYGTSDGRTVDIDPWSVSETGFGFTRTIYDANGGLIAERAFVSYFQ